MTRAPTVPGTEGYAEQAAALSAQYEALPFAALPPEDLHLLPAPPVPALDVGAGPGASAAWLARRGHPVLAVEPVAAFRAAGQAGAARHAPGAVEWLDDALPALEKVCARHQHFGLVLLSAVWMHLDAAEREAAMPVLAGLLAPGGVLVLTLRHGPVPAGRRMFEVGGADTEALAARHGLPCLLHARGESVQPANRAAGVWWTRLVFRRPA